MVEAKEVLCTDTCVTDPKLVSLEDALHRAEVILLGARRLPQPSFF